MKVMFCANCGDIFSLTPSEVRECRCGTVKGKYNPDGHTAVTNGEGYCLGVNNHTLRDAMLTYGKVPGVEERGYEWQRDNLKVEVWIRPHSGPSNPRSEVDTDL